MSRLTRPEREERIERDDGALDETVYVRTHKGAKVTIYHADRECIRVENPGELRELSREKAQHNRKGPCKLCVLDESDQPSTTYDDCPFCGERVGRFVAHLPCDGSAGAAEVLTDD